MLNLLKHCPDDSYIHRIDLTNSIKILIKHLGREVAELKLNKNSFVIFLKKFKDISNDFLTKFLDEELIFGNMRVPSVYAKNTITGYWLEIINHL